MGKDIFVILQIRLVVRNTILHEEVKNDIKNWIQFEMKMNLLGIVDSPILGPRGNKEFVIVATKLWN